MNLKENDIKYFEIENPYYIKNFKLKGIVVSINKKYLRILNLETNKIEKHNTDLVLNVSDIKISKKEKVEYLNLVNNLKEVNLSESRFFEEIEIRLHENTIKEFKNYFQNNKLRGFAVFSDNKIIVNLEGVFDIQKNISNLDYDFIGYNNEQKNVTSNNTEQYEKMINKNKKYVPQIKEHKHDDYIIENKTFLKIIDNKWLSIINKVKIELHITHNKYTIKLAKKIASLIN